MEREQFDQVDNLRYTFLQLQSRALNAQVQLLEMQPTFESELRKNLENFKSDKIEYVHEYRNAGPMQPGLTPREASDKLILFQVRKYSSKVQIMLNFPFIFRIALKVSGDAYKRTKVEKNCLAYHKPTIQN